MKQMGELCGCSSWAVHRRMHDYCIPTRHGGPQAGTEIIKIDKQWLKHQYIDLGMMQVEIAKSINCNVVTVDRSLRKYGILKRTRRELVRALHRRGINIFGRKIRINISKEALNFLNGELLGDGCIMGGFRYTSKHKSYLEWLSKTLASFGIEQGGEIRVYIRKGSEAVSKMYKNTEFEGRYDNKVYTSYCYHSREYVDLMELHAKWYLHDFSFCPSCKILFHDETVQRRQWKNYIRCPICNQHKLKKKTIPKDIELTPMTLRQWYIGDGLNKRTGGIQLFPYSFLPSDRDFLKQKLEQLGFEIKVVGTAFKMNMHNARKFLGYIGPCPIDCYKYKWVNVESYHKRRR